MLFCMGYCGSRIPGVSREHQLMLLPVQNAQNAVPGGLGLGIGDHQLFTEQGIEQGALSHVRLADDVHVSRLMRHSNASETKEPGFRRVLFVAGVGLEPTAFGL